MNAVLKFDPDPVFESSPCECCPLAAQCRAELLACEQFRSFVMFGGRRWRKEPRAPSAQIFEKIFSPTQTMS
jgi:hypothetical protein